MSDKKNFFKYVLFVVFGLIIGIIIKTMFFDICKVSGKSMYPGIQEGQTLAINKLAYGLNRPLGTKLLFQWKEPEKGDVVLFIHKDKAVIKRVAATEGEALEFSKDNGYSLIVGGQVFPLTEAQYQRMKFDHKVPDNTILAIGDNYEESVDSRNYGFIPVNRILGKVICH